MTRGMTRFETLAQARAWAAVPVNVTSLSPRYEWVLTDGVSFYAARPAVAEAAVRADPQLKVLP